MTYLECGCRTLILPPPFMGVYRFCGVHGRLQRVVYVSGVKVRSGLGTPR
jgi:hypothetical protein